jgi:hypothetical protein
VEDRTEIDARMKRCDDANLRFPPTPEIDEAVAKVANGFKSCDPYIPDGRYLKQFRNKKNTVRLALTDPAYTNAMIALVEFTMNHGHEIIADIKACVEHERE